MRRSIYTFKSILAAAIILTVTAVPLVKAGTGGGTVPVCEVDPNGADCGTAGGGGPPDGSATGGDAGGDDAGNGGSGSAPPPVYLAMYCNSEIDPACKQYPWWDEGAGLVLVSVDHNRFANQTQFDNNSWQFLWDQFGELFNCTPAMYGQVPDGHGRWYWGVTYGTVGWDDAQQELCQVTN